MADTVVVEAPARLHFGLLDLRGGMGRRFGGVGAPAPGVSVRVTVSPASEVVAEGNESERAADFARRFLAYHRIGGGARIVVERSIPAHAGLGSGTQLGLSIARALAELHRVAATPVELARAVGRAKRSAVGTWTFAVGGFVVEGGRRIGVDDDVGPLLARQPASVVVAVCARGARRSSRRERSPRSAGVCRAARCLTSAMSSACLIWFSWGCCRR